MDNSNFRFPSSRFRQPKKFATTGITNALLDDMLGMMPTPTLGMDDESDKHPWPSVVVSVKFTGIGTYGYGRYIGKTFQRFIGNPTTYSEALGEVGVGMIAVADDVEIRHLGEVGRATHLIPAGTIAQGALTGFNAEGLQIVEVGNLCSGFFPVAVEKDGGANGTASTVASYTYTLRSIDGVSTLATGLVLSRPREKGPVTFQAGSSGIGVALFVGADLKLWDAGEVYGTATC